MASQPPETPPSGRILDPTPEAADIDRGITPVTAISPAKRTGALALAGVAMVIGIIWVNSGTSRNNGESALMTRNANADRPDSKARQVVAYEPPRETGAGTQPPPQLVPPPDGQVVPAIDPSAPPQGAAGEGRRDPAATLADNARRSTLVAYGGRQWATPSAGEGAGAASAMPASVGASNGTDGEATAPNALDLLRQSSAIGESRASMLPNRNFLITAGTLIPCILETAMNSAQPGYVSCIIPRDVFSENGRVVLMEKGTKILGEYRGGLQQGQNRLFVLWTRAVTPQGVRIDLASPGSDALGRAGLAGAVDTFFWARFGGALLMSLVDDAAYIAGQRIAGANQADNTVRVPSDAAGIALQHNMQIRPVLKKNQGEEVAIFVAKDFNFADVYGLQLRRTP